MFFSRDSLVLIAIFFLAMLTEVLHAPRDWPFWLSWFRPHFTVLVVLLWATYYSGSINFILIWLLGLLLDVLYGSLLGVNAGLLVLISFLAWKFYERFVSYSYFQQVVLVFLACFFYRMILCSIAQDNLVNILMDALVSSSVSSVLWPFFQTFVRKLYQR